VSDGSRRKEERVRETRASYRPKREQPSSSEATEWQWIEANRERLQEQYAGRWIAVADERVVGAGVKLSTAMRQAKRAGIEHPFVTAFKKAEHRGAVEVPHWL
jgi:hypothetical protein